MQTRTATSITNKLKEILVKPENTEIRMKEYDITADYSGMDFSFSFVVLPTSEVNFNTLLKTYGVNLLSPVDIEIKLNFKGGHSAD